MSIRLTIEFDVVCVRFCQKEKGHLASGQAICWHSYPAMSQSWRQLPRESSWVQSVWVMKQKKDLKVLTCHLA